MNNIHMELKDNLTLKKISKINGIKPTPDALINLSDIHLVKIHKLFWAAL
jgi:hypothetical protein